MVTWVVIEGVPKNTSQVAYADVRQVGFCTSQILLLVCVILPSSGKKRCCTTDHVSLHTFIILKKFYMFISIFFETRLHICLYVSKLNILSIYHRKPKGVCHRLFGRHERSLQTI
jgi:hypothetical protein